MMPEQQLREELKGLRAQEQQKRAELVMLQGAIQALQQVLEFHEEAEQQPATPESDENG